MYRDHPNHFTAIAALGCNDIGLLWRLSSEESAGNAGGVGVMGSIPGLGRSPGEGVPTPVFLCFPCGSAGKESACNAGDVGSILGLGRSRGEGNGNPL